MSIKYNGKTVAGKYKAQIVTEATETDKGLIRLATEAEVTAGTDNTTAVTPKKLKTELDKKASTTDITTLEDEVTDLSGRVTANEADIMLKADKTALNDKQDKLVSSTNIKTINNESILGEGNIDIKSGGIELCTILCMPFGVDESENKYRYLNGQILDQSLYPAFTAKVKSWQSTRASLFTTEEEWQAIKTASKLGQCGKFVIDDEAGTIRLPAIININGLADLSKAGLIKEESLPNIKGAVGSDCNNHWYGAFTKIKNYTGNAGQGDDELALFDASNGQVNADGTTFVDKAKSTYQDGAPVQQEAVQYPYVICVNTGVEETERPINNYQVNNTNSYGDSKYVGDMTLNNNSWLKSTGQSNSGTVYMGFYNWAVANIGQPFGAGLIKESSASDITDYDLVIDQAEQTFILPTLNGSENIMSAKYSAMSVGTSPYTYIVPANGWLYMAGSAVSSNNEYIIVYIDKVKTTPIIGRNPLTNASITYLVPVFKGQEVFIEYTASNISKSKFIYAKGNGNLYYYVGDTLENTDLINIARLGEQLSNKVDSNFANVNTAGKEYITHQAMPSDKYTDLTLNASGSTYTAPADGYFILWGSTPSQGWIDFENTTTEFRNQSHHSSNSYVTNWLPLRKGDIVKIQYDGISQTHYFRFYYPVGSEPTA